VACGGVDDVTARHLAIGVLGRQHGLEVYAGSSHKSDGIVG
jgi:hypothetical protein